MAKWAGPDFGGIAREIAAPMAIVVAPQARRRQVVSRNARRLALDSTKVRMQMIYSAAALVCALIGSKWDIREHRIPNLLTGPAILAGLLLHGLVGGWTQLGSSALAGLIGGGIFALFYLAGGMGAGDVKLMVAVGCLLGLYPLHLMLLATAFTGAAYGLALAIRQQRLRQTLANVASILAHHGREGLTPHPDLNLTNPQSVRLPFAVPIAAGCCVAAASALWGR